ncbi:MAG: hypothetical protein ACW967_08175, partial [Candidatus Hodarchaeales archaeon]
MFHNKESNNNKMIYVFGFVFVIILISSAMLVLNNNNNISYIDLIEKNNDLINYSHDSYNEKFPNQFSERDLSINQFSNPLTIENVIPSGTESISSKFSMLQGDFPTTDGEPIFTLNLIVSTNMLERVVYAYQIADGLREIGIEVVVHEMFVDDAFSLMIPATYGDPGSQPRPYGAPSEGGWDLGLSAWWRPSIVAEWWDLFRCYDPGVPESNNSFGGYCNPVFDSYIGDPSSYGEMQRIFYEDRPASIIHHMDTL